MNVLQRGVRSVLRKPIKSIILLFIVIVMSGLFLGAMASRSASIYTQDATRQAIGATFRIEGNEENRRKRLDQAMDVLVSLALIASVCIGENFAAGEVFLVQYSIKAA